MQTRLQSFIEASTGTVVGGIGSWILTYLVLVAAEHYGWSDKRWIAVGTVGVCTVWSLIRGYYMRRHFNRLHTQSSQNG